MQEKGERDKMKSKEIFILLIFIINMLFISIWLYFIRKPADNFYHILKEIIQELIEGKAKIRIKIKKKQK